MGVSVNLIMRKQLPSVLDESDTNNQCREDCLCQQYWSHTEEFGWANDFKFKCQDVSFDPTKDFRITKTGCKVQFNYSTTLKDQAAAQRSLEKAEKSMDKLFTKASWYDFSYSPVKTIEKYANFKLSKVHFDDDLVDQDATIVADDAKAVIITN